MRPEFVPEVTTEITYTPKGRQLVRYRVDTLPRYADRIDNSLKRSMRERSAQVNVWSAVSLGLYIPQPCLTCHLPEVTIIGDGRSNTRVFVEGVQKPTGESNGAPQPYEHFFWQAFNNQNRSRSADENFRLSRLDRRLQSLVGIPTLELHAFAFDDVAETGALREYEVLLGSGRSMKATAETQDNNKGEAESLRLSYIPDTRDGRPRTFLYIRRAKTNGLHYWEFGSGNARLPVIDV